VGTGLFSSVTGVLLLFFMTDTLGVAAATAGLVLFIPKFWDVVFDPLVGIASDRTHSRWGRRQPYLLVGGTLTALAFFALFSGPDLGSAQTRALWVGVIFFVGMSAYALFAVPYAAMPAEMSDDPNERTVIMSWRMGFVLLGTIAGAVAGPMMVQAGGGGREGYSTMGAALAVLIALAMLTTAFSASRFPIRPASAHAMPAREQLRLALANRPYFVLLLAYVLLLAGNGAMAAAAPYFCVHVLGGKPDSVGLVFGCLLLAAIAAMPLWVAAARRFGKPGCAIAAALVFGAALALMAVIDRNSPPQLFYALCAVAGVGFAGTQLLPFSMLTDVIERDAQRSGLRREGSFTGLFIAGEKAGLALGPLITAAVLSVSGFLPSADGAAVQPASALVGAALAFSIVPAAFVVAGAWVLRRYQL
jgi:Na+/melibiose symporter-like transporter